MIANSSIEGSGGYGYLLEPLWWIGMFTMVFGEFANFVAYMYGPAVLVTPLGALSIIVSSFLTERNLEEDRNHRMCFMYSGFCSYCASCTWRTCHQLSRRNLGIGSTASFSFLRDKHHGLHRGVCSIIGALTVVSVKALGIAIKLTLEGSSPLQALDTINTAVVSPIYYAMFTSLTIIASAIMFKDWSGQSASSIVSVLCGFITVLSGTMVLHNTRDPEKQLTRDYSPQISWVVHGNGEIWKQEDNDGLQNEYVAITHQDHFK
ncbi:putative magnesium transporter NIPA6 [Salvia divinorum]|uniref:Probable magnesium transporter n=1 Tax=Salvia divinorum TaxID=28513 RepID=A0ABD1HKQ0_SALDI